MQVISERIIPDHHSTKVFVVIVFAARLRSFDLTGGNPRQENCRYQGEEFPAFTPPTAIVPGAEKQTAGFPSPGSQPQARG
jgi:hypothetical protein